ncbi:hypothetical protein RCH21_000516 [Arthrobacter sp. PL16]|uniref:hypothetical protein n=1 Tax=Arthrobacter sp. PL16 TaxID=3071720 RepID=UPI002DFECE37|nr:hypothetical protein [Arthrobacter sp. PL16]
MNVSLLSDSCTTGWMNWGHGELWLTPDHLVRIGRRGLTLRSAALGGAMGGAMVAGGILAPKAVEAADRKFGENRLKPGASMDVDADQWERQIAAHPQRTLMLPLKHIANVDLRLGLSTSRLNVAMTDGKRHKLLWMFNEHAAPLLAGKFGPQLGQP